MNTDIFKKSNKNDVYAKLQQKVGSLLALFNRVNKIESTLLPGVIFEWGGETAPNGYILAQGQAISRIAYADLFAAYGTVHGIGDGSTTFNVPDYTGRVAVGQGDTGSGIYDLGDKAGAKSVALDLEEIPGHVHTLSSDAVVKLQLGFDPGDSNTWRDGYFVNEQAASQWTEVPNGDFSPPLDVSGSTDSTGGFEGSAVAHNNMQPYIVVNKIIYTGVFN